MTTISVDIADAVSMSGISRSGLYKLFKAKKITPERMASGPWYWSRSCRATLNPFRKWKGEP